MSTYHTAARAWARWTIDAESMRGSEAPTPSRRCRRSWTIGDRFSRSAENRIGRPPRRYGCRAELKKKSGLQGLAGEVLTIYREGDARVGDWRGVKFARRSFGAFLVCGDRSHRGKACAGP